MPLKRCDTNTIDTDTPLRRDHVRLATQHFPLRHRPPTARTTLSGFRPGPERRDGDDGDGDSLLLLLQLRARYGCIH